ncbi:MAG: hypothetical protein ABIQ95_16140 [Bdellovibrionia bacterium]
MIFREIAGLLASGFTLVLFVMSAGAAESKKNNESERVYVQSVKADLKVEPQLNASSVLSLKRGAELLVIKKEGSWFNVSAAGKTGWISKLFVNSNRPVGEAELASELSNDKNLAKAARRRSASYSVSASTRGLTGGSRVREGREKYPSDYDAVDKIDKSKISEKDVKKFQEDGKLSQ